MKKEKTVLYALILIFLAGAILIINSIFSRPNIDYSWEQVGIIFIAVVGFLYATHRFASLLDKIIDSDIACRKKENEIAKTLLEKFGKAYIQAQADQSKPTADQLDKLRQSYKDEFVKNNRRKVIRSFVSTMSLLHTDKDEEKKIKEFLPGILREINKIG